MTTASTVYDVRIRYLLDDKASKALAGINSRAGKAAKSTGLLGSALGKLAVVAGGAFGLKKAIDFTIGFNRNLEKTRTQLTTVVQSLTKVGRKEALGKASTLMTQLRQDAKSSAGTFQEMTDFSAQIAPAVLKAGASMKDLREITKGGVVAAAAFGETSEFAAIDIKQALTKGVTSKDRFSSLLLASVDTTAEAFNKLDTAARLQTLQKAFNQPAIKEAAEAYQTSFEGTFSTFKSGLQEFGGKVGSKLFARLSVELGKINKWFDANEKRVDDFAKTLANGLVKGFQIVKSVFGFIIEHKTLLLTIAKAVLISKGIGGMAGAIANFPRFNKGMSSFAGKLGAATQGLAALAIGAQVVADAVLERQKKRIDRQANNAALIDAARGLGGGKRTAGARAGAEAMGRRLGFKSDLGSGGAVGRGSGLLTAGEKGASRIVNTLLSGKGKNIISDRKNRIANLKEIQKQIPIGVKGNDVFRLAQLDAQEQFGKNFDQLDAGRQGALLKEHNVGSRRSADVTAMSELLIGLDVALRQANREQGEIFIANLRADAERRDVSFAQVLAEKFGSSIKDAFSPLVNVFNALTGGTKASEAKVRDKKNNTKVGKVVINVTSDDPDRMAFGLEGLFSDLAKNGAQAVNAPRGF